MAKNKNQTANTVQDMDDDFPYEVASIVTVPTLKVEEHKAVFVCFDRAIQAKSKADKNGAQEVDENGEAKTIDIAQVVNLRTGEINHLVCGAALVDNLKDAYPNESYVGKCFRLEKSAVAGKRWKAWDIREIKDPRTN